MNKKFTGNKLLVAIIYSFINIFCMLIFYPVLPILLNYPEGTVNTEFQKLIEGMTYNEQFVIASVALFVISLLLFLYELNKLEKLRRNQDDESLLRLRKKCLTLPYKAYIIQIFVPTLLLLPILFFMGVEKITIMRLSITVFALFSILAGFSLMFVKKIYIENLVKTYTEYGKYEQDILNKKYGVERKILLQLIPMFVSAMLLLALVGYSKVIDEKGTMLYQDYKFRLDTLNYEYEDLDTLNNDLTKLLKNNDMSAYFIVNYDNIYVSDNKMFSSEFIKYMDYYSRNNGGRVYDYYTSVQAVVREIKFDSQVIMVGIRYNVVSDGIFIYYLISFIALTLINLFILINFGKSIAFDIRTVSERLNKALNTDDIEKISKIPITSDDEIGELEFAFNQILDLEKDQINQLKQSQETLMEQERLVTLGELAGGMAHDINTPLSTVITGVDYFAKNIESNENNEKMLELMRKSINKISNIVNSVRDQIRNLGSATNEKFEISQSIEAVENLLFTELNRNKCKIELEKDEEICLYGDRGKFERVITNIVLNSVQAYENVGGIIKIKICKNDGKANIIISDNAGGIPPKIADSLLKQIVSTKGSRGTGFGLYFSNSIIKGVFKGEIKFETQEGVGTTFYIVLPI